MKQFCLILFALLFVVISLNAQKELQQKEKRFGFKLGSNYSNMVFSDQFNNIETAGKIKPKPGIVFGLTIEIPLVKKLSLQTEYSFTVRNTEVVNSGRNYKLTYLSLPVLLKYKLAKRFSIAAGPEADLLVFSKRKTNGKEVDIIHQTEERNVAAVFEVEYNLYKPFYLTANYLKGLNDIGLENLSTEFKYKIAQLSLVVKF